MNRTLVKRTLVIAILCVAAVSARAQKSTQKSLDRLFPNAEVIGKIPMTFPGPKGGNTFLHMPIREVKEWGDTVVTTHAYLLNLNISNDGIYLTPDTIKSFSSNTPFEFVFSPKRSVHANLTPTRLHEEYAQLDTTYGGQIGYGMLKQFVSAFDFRKNTLTLYPLYTTVNIPGGDSTLELPLIDDAKITYCGCNFPTIWLDGEAPPFKSGYLHLAFDEPLSQIYENALDDATTKIVQKQYLKDSLEGKKRPIGFNLGQFYVKTASGKSENLAKRSPHRGVAELPKQYHDLNVPLLGSVGTDFIRTYSALIIDPTKQKLIFIK